MRSIVAILCLSFLSLAFVLPGRDRPDLGDPSSSDWLGLLADGPTKRQFIIDCTGCHQFDSRMTRRFGRARTEAEWREAVHRMLGFAGPGSGFPVISAAQHPDSTAAWLARSLGDRIPERGDSSADPRVTEFLFPAAQDLPHDIAIDSAGRVVVTGMFSGAMYVLEPESGEFSRVEIPVEQANPRAVEIDRQGRWWVVLGNPRQLARFDGENWSTFDVGVYAHSVALDSAGGAWVNGHFTRQPELLVGIDRQGNAEQVTLPDHPDLAARPGGPVPYELRTGPDGRIWMSELQGNRMIAYDPATRTSRAYGLPSPSSGPRRFDVGQDGAVWIPAYGAGSLLRLDPSSGAVREISLPIEDAAPYVVRIDASGGVWIGTGAADALFRYDPATGRFETIRLPTRGAVVRHMAIDRRNGDVWLAYGESPGKVPARIARFRR
jgi:virginiamycin B lyase